MTLRSKSNNITSFICGLFIIAYAIIVKSEIELSFSLDYYTILLFIGAGLILLSLLEIDSSDAVTFFIILISLIYLLLFLSKSEFQNKIFNIIISFMLLLFICAAIAAMVDEVMINNYYTLYTKNKDKFLVFERKKELIKKEKKKKPKDKNSIKKLTNEIKELKKEILNEELTNEDFSFNLNTIITLLKSLLSILTVVITIINLLIE